MPTHEIMKYSGHSTEENLSRYLKATTVDVLEKIETISGKDYSTTKLNH